MIVATIAHPNGRSIENGRNGAVGAVFSEPRWDSTRIGPRFQGTSPVSRKVPDGVSHSFFVGGNELIHGGVDLVIDLFARRVGVEPGEGLPNALGKGGRGGVAGNETLDFRVVEDDARGFVSEQGPFFFGDAGGDEVGRNMHQLRLYADSGAHNEK